MDKRYQVFLSSTYEDLKEQRLEVMKAILELDCIPCGMEYFPATSEDQWSYIKVLIDQCDYYVVIVAARYGSNAPDGISYTRKEYEYAISIGIPTIAFIHADPESIPAKFSETTKEGKRKLEDFRKFLRTRLCKEWKDVHELGAVVSRSLTQLIKRNPRPGWVRAEGLASPEASQEILRLKSKVEEQEKDLEALRLSAPADTETLAQGSDPFAVQCSITLRNKELQRGDPKRITHLQESFDHRWDDIFSSFATYLLVENDESEIKSAINKMLREKHEAFIATKYPDLQIYSLNITEECFQTIKLQFNALGLIELFTKDGSQSSTQTLKRMYQLSPRGKRHLVNIRAIHKSSRAYKKQKARLAPY